MKRSYLLLAVTTFFVFACGNSNESSTSNDETTANSSMSEDDDESEDGDDESEASSTQYGICLWKELSLKDGAGADAKWKTTIYLGEKMDYSGNSETITEKGKEVTYHEVSLIDDTKGWVRADFVSLNAQRAALKTQSKVYKRPDILTATEKELDEMDFVAVLKEKGDWVQIKCKRPSDKWFVSGYVKKSNLSFEETDVAVSLLYQKAQASKNEDDKAKALEQILDNQDLKTSGFYGKIKNMMEESSGYSFYVNSDLEAEVGIVPYEIYEDWSDWSAHWPDLKSKGLTKTSPAYFEGVKPGEYAVIFKHDVDSTSKVSVQMIMVSKEKHDQEYFALEEEYR